MTIPEVRDAMSALASDLYCRGDKETAEELCQLVSELYRRPAVRKAAPRRSGVSSLMIRAYAAEHPLDDYMDIAQHFGVNTARVSEAVAGFRE